jgi:hypothetical protein
MNGIVSPVFHAEIRACFFTPMGNQGKSEKQIISFEFYTHVVSFSL